MASGLLPLKLVDAGEFADPSLPRQPGSNRCYSGRSNLTALLARMGPLGWRGHQYRMIYRTTAPVCRPRRSMACCTLSSRCADVKADVARLARELGLGELGELRAAPCLASRKSETGLAGGAAADLAGDPTVSRRLCCAGRVGLISPLPLVACCAEHGGGA